MPRTLNDFCKFASEGASVLSVPASLDPRRLTYAFAKVESGLGIHADRSRFEPSYSGNHYRRLPINTTMYERSKLTKDAWARWGDAAACSYGLFQIMYTTALTLGAVTLSNPPETLRNDNVNFTVFAQLINKVCADRPDITLEQLADAYNSGNCYDAIIPTTYVSKIIDAYHAAEDIFEEYDCG